MNIRIVAIPTTVAENVRSTLRSPKYGHPAHTEVAKGYGPCRHCLRYFDVGNEERILFTWDAFSDLKAMPQPGPVYIHAESCPRYEENAGFPNHLLAHPLTLIAYGAPREHREQIAIDANLADLEVKRLLYRDDVAYVQVYDTEAGCFDFRIERDDSEGAGSIEGAGGVGER